MTMALMSFRTEANREELFYVRNRVLDTDNSGY